MKAKIKIQLKKDTVQDCVFNVRQAVPFPRISGWAQTWENDDGALFGRCGHSPEGLKEDYYCDLLRSDMGPEYVEKGTREDHAGFVPYAGYGKDPLPANPGTIVFRGKDLGEMSFRMSRAWNSGMYAHGLTCPDAIREQIETQLSAFIEQNKAELYRDAVERTKANVLAAIQSAKDNVKEAEEKALEALKAL